MPASIKGMAFRYFDKVLCGLVGLALAFCIFYAVRRNARLSARIDPQQITQLVQKLEQRQAEPPPEVEEPELRGKIAQRFQVERTPKPLRDIMLPPLPVVYSPESVGRSMKFVLEFNAPLAPGSIDVEGKNYLLEVLEHPFQGDYGRVQVRSSKSWEGRASVVGVSGEIKHIYPVVISKAVGKTPYAPEAIRVLRNREVVRLAIRPDQRIESEKVKVRYYEVWRRDWSEPTGEYEPVAWIEPEAAVAEREGEPEAEREQPSPTRPGAVPEGLLPEGVLRTLRQRGMQPGGRPAAESERQEAAPKRVTRTQAGEFRWTDAGVTPGRRYGYKVRIVGRNTYPTKGEFAGPVTAKVWPNMDFRFTLTGADRVRFEIVKQFGGTFRSESFWVAVGEQLGGVEKDRSTGKTRNYATGYTLVDFHPEAVNPDTGNRAARVVYADEEGVLHELYRNQSRFPELWDRAREARLRAMR